MDTCLFCHGTIDLTTRRCQQCGQLQPARPSEPTIPTVADAATAASPTRSCPDCGAEIPQWMRFCGYCGHSLPPLVGDAPDRGSPLPDPKLPTGPEAANMHPPGTRPAPQLPQHVPLRKKVLVGGLTVTLAVVITVAFTQGSALLRRALSTSPSASPTPSTLVAGQPGTISEVPLPTTAANELNSITAGLDGNVWFTEDAQSKIGRITPQGVITEFPVLITKDNTPLFWITTGPDGNLWFAEGTSNQIGQITPEGIVTLMPLPTNTYSGERPGGIATGPDGNLWITEPDRIARITPEGSVTEFPFPEQDVGADYSLGGITAGPDGNLWFTVSKGLSGNTNAQIGRITPQGVFTEFPLPPQWQFIGRITKGPDGNLWFTMSTQLSIIGAQIGRITPQGVFTEFPLPDGGGAEDITAGPDGNLWYVTPGPTIGRVTPEGKVTEFRVPNAVGLLGAITAGPDGNIWFTDSSSSQDNSTPCQIGRLILRK